MTKKKKLLVALAVVAAVAVIVAVVLWYLMQQPLYSPGKIRSMPDLEAMLTPPGQSGEEEFWTVQEKIKLYHFAYGSGKPILFLHGGPGIPVREKPPGMQLLDTAFRFMYYDQRGCGKSTRPIDRFPSENYYGNMTTLEGTLGLTAQIADIERIRRLLGLEKLTLMGHSFGGFLAALYAAEFPERVERLVLVAPASVLVMPPEDGGLYEQIKPLLPESMRAEYDQYLDRLFDFGTIFSKSDADLAALNAEFGRYYRAALETKRLPPPPEAAAGEQGGWMVQAMYFSMGRRHDYRDALKKVTAPVLVMHGELDLQTEKASRGYVELFPNAKFVVISHAGHFVFSEQPGQFAKALGEFLHSL